MHTRIKYEFSGPIGISRQSFLIAEGKYARVMVDKSKFTFTIRDSEGNVLVEGGNTKNYIVLLRQAKRALEDLGCDFTGEDRNRNYGLVKKTQGV